MAEQVKIACGVFGAINFSSQFVFPNLYWGLRAQNHRGHQSHGFLTHYKGDFHIHRSLDLVPKIKSKDVPEWVERLPGPVGIGNVRYSTSGKTDEKSLIEDTQPVTASIEDLRIGISYNGNVVNTSQLEEELTQKIPGFSYQCDAELICNKLLIELKKEGNLPSAVKTCMQEIEGAFSVVGVTHEGTMFAFRDPNGIRPLCAGHSKDQPVLAFASETVALDINGFQRDFEVERGELVTVSEEGFQRKNLVKDRRKAFCAFEFAYFARPDSRFNDKYVYEIREEFGRNLVRENPDIVEDADIILSLPQTGNDPALGAHEESGLKWERASRRHRYVTERAFILLDRERYSTIDKKINILAPKVEGKRVIVIDDSIVRGDTTRVIVDKLREMGAEKVYVLITFPCIIGPCFYGVDMATYGQLIGSKYNCDEIAEEIGVDALRYQSLEGFIKATGFKSDQLCQGCITGNYPTTLAQKIADETKEKFLKGYDEEGRLYETVQTVD
ncbi:MAG: amidophosphoribosyltransferase [Thermoproteota archaeon]